MYLIFDTETNGLPSNYRLPAEYTNNWPQIVQLSWGIYYDNGDLKESHDYIIKPNGFTITEESIKIHKITNELAHKVGHNIKDALYKFKESLKTVQTIVAHNFDFDINVLGAEYIRNGIKLYYKNIKREICTMKSTTQYCAIPSPNYPTSYKWPKLQELHKKLFNKEFENSHNSKYDVEACAKCLFECLARDIIHK